MGSIDTLITALSEEKKALLVSLSTHQVAMLGKIWKGRKVLNLLVFAHLPSLRACLSMGEHYEKRL